MTFYNHCTEELRNEAKRVIAPEAWHPKFKDQLLCTVVDELECGQPITSDTGGMETIPFILDDVKQIVSNTLLQYD